MTVAHRIRRALRRTGIEATRANAFNSWDLRLPRLLEQHGVRTVLDVGANDGGFAASLFGGGFAGQVVSFEPLPAAWAALSERASRVTRWRVAPPMALSDENGETVFYEAGNSVSSSLLLMTGAHAGAAPQSRTVGNLRVRTRRLDDVLPELDAPSPFFLKLDVQG